ncbi:MAG: hypothetical protein FWD57_02475 [Polyangiaceae bacterium]|nr:hypothetical protein [Polyangiaceae bacterium]
MRDAKAGLEKAVTVCGGWSPQRCSILGTSPVMEMGGRREIERGAQMLAWQIQAGDPWSRIKRADALVEGQGVKRHIAVAREIVDKACGAGIPIACEMVKQLPKEG